MDSINIELLRIIGNINNRAPVSLKSVDMRIMQKYPDVILNKELLKRIDILIGDKSIVWVKENVSVQIADKGSLF